MMNGFIIQLQLIYAVKIITNFAGIATQPTL
jgi:hypothetical protein